MVMLIKGKASCNSKSFIISDFIRKELSNTANGCRNTIQCMTYHWKNIGIMQMGIRTAPEDARVQARNYQ